MIADPFSKAHDRPKETQQKSCLQEPVSGSELGSVSKSDYESRVVDTGTQQPPCRDQSQHECFAGVCVFYRDRGAQVKRESMNSQTASVVIVLLHALEAVSPHGGLLIGLVLRAALKKTRTNSTGRGAFRNPRTTRGMDPTASIKLSK
jgi:hypothetical protein